jgi:hypothetical protein
MSSPRALAIFLINSISSLGILAKITEFDVVVHR